MTELVIIDGCMKKTVVEILCKWPDRQAVHEDASCADTSLSMVAIHRWFQRGNVPAKYWSALIDGAKRRGIAVTAEDIVSASAVTQEDAA
jgi:hypothetical protein